MSRDLSDVECLSGACHRNLSMYETAGCKKLDLMNVYAK
jgi:hypothetical protein